MRTRSRSSSGRFCSSPSPLRRSSGTDVYNQEQFAHDGDPISFGRYLTSSAFGRAVMENWQSEYLQFTLFILATVWLVQKGSPESKPVGAPHGVTGVQG